VIFDSRNPAGRSHDGGRILFGPDGMLYVAVGEDEHPGSSQDLRSPRGKILRITPTGGIPPDNPFPGSPIFVYGIRNSFGFDFDQQTGALWGADNGPDCNDELDRFVAGRNYGWGSHQTCRGRRPFDTNQDGPHPVLPLLSYTPVVVPTGVAFCDRCGLGPIVEGTLLFGTFRRHDIRMVRLTRDRLGVVSQQVVFHWRHSVLSLETGPDGSIYFSDRVGIHRLVLAP
jgi:glucose/arabinose dehydrogenase